MKEYLDTHPQVRTALRVFAYSFLSVFSLTLMDFLNDFREWAEGEDLPFPVFATIWNKMGFTKSSVYVGPPN
jgi:hypothetical protein